MDYEEGRYIKKIKWSFWFWLPIKIACEGKKLTGFTIPICHSSSVFKDQRKSIRLCCKKEAQLTIIMRGRDQPGSGAEAEERTAESE